jgi:hypothetical protein
VSIPTGGEMASAANGTGHTIATAATLRLKQTESGGGGHVDFWRVGLAGGDVVQFSVNEPNNDNTYGYYFEFYKPATTDTSFALATPLDITSTNGNVTSVITLQAPYTGTFVLAVCEGVNGAACGTTVTGGGQQVMGAYTFKTALLRGPRRGAAPSAPPTGSRNGTLTIVGLMPSHAVVFLNAPHKPLLIEWKGSATFPLTAYATPTAHCSTASFSCASGEGTFAASGNHQLTWSKGNVLWCAGALSSPHTGVWDVYIEDARHVRSAAVSLTITCDVARASG